MKVLIDTNIVLNGAFNRYTVARDLVNTTDKLNHYISYSSIREVDNLLKTNCSTRKEIEKASLLVREYLQNLGCIILSPGDPKLSLEILDLDDRPIVSTAKENLIETICSYNIQDILDFNGTVRTPLELVREHGQNLINYLFRIKGKKIGTIFSIIEPSHKSSIGDLFTTDDGTEHFINKDGFYSYSNTTFSLKIKNEIISGERIGLVIRSKEGFYEASCWVPEKDKKWYHGNRFSKTVLAEGFAEPPWFEVLVHKL
jgi:predicted nucleic acid-binding protein